MVAPSRVRPWYARCLAAAVVITSCLAATAAQAGWFDSLTGSERRADVRLESLALDKRQARVGETVRATVAVSNWGFLRAQNARLTLLAAPGANAQITQAARLTSVELGTLDGKARLSYVATFPVPSWARPGAHRVFATIETRTAESKRGNNTTTTTLEVLGTSTSAQSSTSSPSLSIVTLPPPSTQTSISPSSGPSPAPAEAACDYYASPTGNSSNDGLSSTTPFRPQDFWRLAQPGKTLCLMNGVYRGDAFMLDPHRQGQAAPVGTAASPITVRALNDGRARFDGQGERRTVYFSGAQWLVLEGFNAHNSSEAVVSIGRSSDITLRRVVMWDAKDCPDGSCTWHVFTTTYATNVLCEDCAAFGYGRKQFQPQISTNVTCRRCWGRWEGYVSPSSVPRTPFHFDYNTHPSLVENSIGIWSAALTASCWGNYPVFFSSPGSTPALATRILGSFAYVMPSAPCTTNDMVGSHTGGFLTIQDVITHMPGWTGEGASPLDLRDTTPSVTGTVTRVSTFGPPNSIGTQFTTSAVCSSTTYPGRCSSPWDPAGANARMCHRYVDGVQTTTPLWPWPMDERIKNALASAGRSLPEGGSVTTEIESLLGPIPAACRTDGLGR